MTILLKSIRKRKMKWLWFCVYSLEGGVYLPPVRLPLYWFGLRGAVHHHLVESPRQSFVLLASILPLEPVSGQEVCGYKHLSG